VRPSSTFFASPLSRGSTLGQIRKCLSRFLCGSLLLFPVFHFGREADPSPQPSLIPSRIILTWSGDPTRTQAVTWRTEVPLQSPQAQISRFNADPNFVKDVTTIPGMSTLDDLGNGKVAGHYAATFTGLEPGTKYCYRVGDGQTWSEWNSFRTAASQPDPFRFIYLGDAQNNIRSMCSRTFRMRAS